MTIPDTELEAIEARCKAATVKFVMETKCNCAETPPTYPVFRDTPHLPGCQYHRAENTSELLGTDLPKLLAAYRELRADRERLDWLATCYPRKVLDSFGHAADLRQVIDAARAFKEPK